MLSSLFPTLSEPAVFAITAAISGDKTNAGELEAGGFEIREDYWDRSNWRDSNEMAADEPSGKGPTPSVRKHANISISHTSIAELLDYAQLG